MKHAIQNTIMAGLVSVGLVGTSRINLENRIFINTEVMGPSAKSIFDDIQKITAFNLPFETITLVLNSPGGSLSSMGDMIKELKQTEKQVDTEITEDASSAAAILFTIGKNRTMYQNSTILFHRVRLMVPISLFMEVPVTAQMLQEYIDVGEVRQPSDPNYNLEMIQGLNNLLKTIPKSVILKAIAGLNTSDARLITILVQHLGRSKEWVIQHLLPIGKDVTYTAQQAYELGIATQIRKEP